MEIADQPLGRGHSPSGESDAGTLVPSSSRAGIVVLAELGAEVPRTVVEGSASTSRAGGLGAGEVLRTGGGVNKIRRLVTSWGSLRGEREAGA